MEETFLAPAREAHVEFIERRSRFIGHVAPAFSAGQAEGYISSIRKEHRSATHNVYAYVISHDDTAGNGPVERVSDDGEPKGTAGYPVLEVIKKRGTSNVVCVVTRYFGGILLGSGGLIRAYGKAASMALDAAGVAQYARHALLRISLDYDQFGKVKHELASFGYSPSETLFGEKVTLESYVKPGHVSPIIARIRDLTAGKGEVRMVGEKYLKCQ